MYTIFLQDTIKIPRAIYIARLGSQSQRWIRFISSAHGVCHKIKENTTCFLVNENFVTRALIIINRMISNRCTTTLKTNFMKSIKLKSRVF